MSTESVMPSNHLILRHPLLLLPSIFSSIRVLPMSRLFAADGQSVGASASASVPTMNFQDWFPLGLTGLISFQSKGLPRVFSNTIQKHQFFGAQPFSWSSSHIHTWLLEKTIALTRRTYVSKVLSLLFNMLFRCSVIPFLPRSKHLLIPWLQSPSTVILEPKKIKSLTVCIVFPSFCHEVMKLDAMILVFWILSFKLAFPLSSSLSSRSCLVPLHFLP